MRKSVVFALVLATMFLLGSSNAGAGIGVIDCLEIDCTAPPVIACNAPATIVPPDAPVSFSATAVDGCPDDLEVEVIGYDCYFFSKKGKRIDRTESCIVLLDGDTVTILDSGGVGDNITWTVHATDSCGNVSELTCSVLIEKAGQP